MSEIFTWIGGILLGVPVYLGGLLVWPACAYFWRGKMRRGRVLRWAFAGQLLLLLVLIGFFVFSRGILEHQYYWLMCMIILNVLFLPFHVGAAIYDYFRSEVHRA
ncbi:MAG TPA: hypothetical protein VJA21_09690 [Verrucomicrobiae bacterium]